VNLQSFIISDRRFAIQTHFYILFISYLTNLPKHYEIFGIEGCDSHLLRIAYMGGI